MNEPVIASLDANDEVLSFEANPKSVICSEPDIELCGNLSFIYASFISDVFAKPNSVIWVDDDIIPTDNPTTPLNAPLLPVNVSCPGSNTTLEM